MNSRRAVLSVLLVLGAGAASGRGLYAASGDGALRDAAASAKAPGRRLGPLLRWNQDVQINAKDMVEGPVIAFNGSISVAGSVEGPVIALGGSVSLRPGARVEGPVMASRGQILLDPDASVDGPVLELPGLAWRKIGLAIGSLAGLAGSFWLAYKILSTLGSIAAALLLWILFAKALETSRQSLDARPGLCALAGILFWPCLSLLGLALLISILGIPLLPFLALAVVCAWFWGFTTLGFWLGQRLSTGLWQNPLVSVLAGTALLKALHWVPLVQGLVCLAVAVLGVGAAVASRFGTRALGPRAP